MNITNLTSDNNQLSISIIISKESKINLNEILKLGVKTNVKIIEYPFDYRINIISKGFLKSNISKYREVKDCKDQILKQFNL